MGYVSLEGMTPVALAKLIKEKLDTGIPIHTGNPSPRPISPDLLRKL